MKSIKEIKNEASLAGNIDEYNCFLELYKSDERQGVIALVNSIEKKKQAYFKELERLEKLSEFERECFNEGFSLVGGIDEVGRGPLAGPVVTACVILPENLKIPGVNDSKKLSAQKREALYDEIMEKAVSVGIGMADNNKIDEINILQATYMAMRNAIEAMPIKPEVLLVDAVTIPGIDIKQKAIIKGDAKSISIGAASIIAKVTRDRLMKGFHQIYGEYDFESNMGYGTQKHIDGIKKFGLCPIHRRSFTKSFVEE